MAESGVVVRWTLFASGRVTYEDTSREFTLFADRRISKNKRQVSAVVVQFEIKAQKCWQVTCYDSS
jgi:hypothetical protein